MLVLAELDSSVSLVVVDIGLLLSTILIEELLVGEDGLLSTVGDDEIDSVLSIVDGSMG